MSTEAEHGSLEHIARELAESWINGNRKDVLSVLTSDDVWGSQITRLGLAARIAEIVPELGGHLIRTAAEAWCPCTDPYVWDGYEEEEEEKP